MGLLPCLTKVRTTHRLTGPGGGKGPASACTVPSRGGVGARSACRSRHTALSGTATRKPELSGKTPPRARGPGTGRYCTGWHLRHPGFEERSFRSDPEQRHSESTAPPCLRLRNPPDRTHRALPGPAPRTPGARQPSSHPRTHARGSSPPLPFPHAPVPSRALSLDRHQRPPQPAKTYSIRHWTYWTRRRSPAPLGPKLRRSSGEAWKDPERPRLSIHQLVASVLVLSQRIGPW